ncbi:MAG: hypothetical protein H7Z19_04725, partial [Chitinophagaceae bacterium]|nr:hypothetical protein [Rubrivivax sp.]
RAWPAAQRVQRQACCIDYMALLAALRGRLSDAALLVGAAEAQLATADNIRQVNEAAAHARTLSLLAQGLSPAEMAACQRLGATLADADVAPLAFGLKAST